jgi:hypothetical protein
VQGHGAELVCGRRILHIRIAQQASVAQVLTHVHHDALGTRVDPRHVQGNNVAALRLGAQDCLLQQGAFPDAPCAHNEPRMLTVHGEGAFVQPMDMVSQKLPKPLQVLLHHFLLWHGKRLRNVVLFLAKITLVCRAMSALCSASCACKAVDRSKPLSDDIVAVLQVIRRFYVRDIPLTHVVEELEAVKCPQPSWAFAGLCAVAAHQHFSLLVRVLFAV